ncbi:MAG: RNA polymerase subunit sigma [Candidatus Eisenbacteria bacterium]|uniref:RNA polymerase subunit sigma n=1 Tax=Eiseniibacteriota bacterium TaxID=2212470 RepID=A0A956SGH5_UNCEI|nr:RNA polymerase subunit sigma [Candidatus Eisenbacteria bacterium]
MLCSTGTMGPSEVNDPSSGAEPDLTRLLNLAAKGDEEAGRIVMPRIYGELRRIAASKRRVGGSDESVRPTVLVHEAYLRLVKGAPDGWEARSHFFFAAARAMRDILVETARRQETRKHGGGLERVEFEEAGITVDAKPDDILGLDRCLERLAAEDEIGSNIVLLRYFVGMTVPEIAELLRTSVSTVERKWSFLRVWLASELSR